MAEAGTRTARFWRDLPLLALILVLSVLLGFRAASRRLGFIGIAIVIPLAVFAFQPDRAWRPTADNPQAGQTASAGAAPAQALERDGDDDVVEVAPKEANIERQPAADVDTVAGAIVAGMEEKSPAQETPRTEPPRQDAKPTEQSAQEMRTTEQPMQEAGRQLEPDATQETNPIAGAPAGPAVDVPAPKDRTGSTVDRRWVKPEAVRRGRETSWRRSLRAGRHYRVVWSYLTHATGVARMGPAPLYLDR